MLDRTLAAASDSPTIGGVVGFAILLIIVVGILVKLIIVLTRRGKTGSRRKYSDRSSNLAEFRRNSMASDPPKVTT